jgi:acylphosphatase
MERKDDIRAFIIYGRVQGVGFRFWARKEASRLGIRGFVRNRRDGSVEALLAGTPEAVAEMTELLKDGPTGAEVKRIEKISPPEKVPDGFLIDFAGKASSRQ